MHPKETGRKNLVPKNRETGGIAKQGGAKQGGPTVVGSILMVWMGFLVMLITIQKIIDQIVFDTLIDYADAYSNL